MDINDTITIKTPINDSLNIPLHISDFDREAQRVAARTDEQVFDDDDMAAMFARALVAS